ncbi:MAG: hypothetical protein MZW92_51670 [Comamonadaceae bacterium]|nr:hypothetical protein [Comamonadaceae bacterium]
MVGLLTHTGLVIGTLLLVAGFLLWRGASVPLGDADSDGDDRGLSRRGRDRARAHDRDRADGHAYCAFRSWRWR